MPGSDAVNLRLTQESQDFLLAEAERLKVSPSDIAEGALRLLLHLRQQATSGRFVLVYRDPESKRLPDDELWTTTVPSDVLSLNADVGGLNSYALRLRGGDDAPDGPGAPPILRIVR